MARWQALAKREGASLPVCWRGCRDSLQLRHPGLAVFDCKWRISVGLQVWHAPCITGSGPNGLQSEVRPFLVSGLRLPVIEKALRTGPAERFFVLASGAGARVRALGFPSGARPFQGHPSGRAVALAALRAERPNTSERGDGSAPPGLQGRPAARSDATFRSHERGFRAPEGVRKTKNQTALVTPL